MIDITMRLIESAHPASRRSTATAPFITFVFMARSHRFAAPPLVSSGASSPPLIGDAESRRGIRRRGFLAPRFGRDPLDPRGMTRPHVREPEDSSGAARGRSTLLSVHLDETLAQAALRFVFSRPFLACALPGMWLDEEVEENYQALAAYASGKGAYSRSLETAAQVADLTRQAWLPQRYQWLDQKWRVHRPAPL